MPSKPIKLLQGLSFALAAFFHLAEARASAAEISITIDDPSTDPAWTQTAEERNGRILEALRKHKTQAILFVCGKRIDSPPGIALIKEWTKEGHWLGNHSYSHENYNAKTRTFETFRADLLKAEGLIKDISGFHKIFRFPFLKEGDTATKRDQMRAFLKESGYTQGFVTVDASDWYVNLRLLEKLKADPKADMRPYRDFYLKHIWERAQFYNDLSKKVLGREVKHTLLLHHNLLNAYFLDDLLGMFAAKGWKVIAAKDAIKDPVFKATPRIVPAGESILWSLAKETGKYESILRFPGESEDYEKEAMDRLGL